jgi:hypothetical protein
VIKKTTRQPISSSIADSIPQAGLGLKAIFMENQIPNG